MSAASEENDAAPKAGRLTPVMRIVIAAVSAVVVAGVITTVILLNTNASPDPGANGAADPEGTAPSGSSRMPNEQNAQGDPAPTTPASPGPSPGALPTTGSEVLPPTATPKEHLPPVTPTPPLLSNPLPGSASATGSVVEGFPTDILGPLPKSTVASTSIATENSTTQISLVGESSRTADEIRADYDERWTSLGLRKQDEEDSSTTYIRSYESIVLAVESADAGARYTVYAVFRTE